MFEWSQGTVLRSMVDGGVPGAGFDDWLEGWLFGLLRCRFRIAFPLKVLDITLGNGARPHLESLKDLGAEVDILPADGLADAARGASGTGKYDLVTLLSLERESCLRPIDFENPLPFLEMLVDATRLLSEGGALIWSHLYCFPRDPDNLTSLFEPATIYQSLVRRISYPLSDDYYGKERILIEHDPDTLFVRHKAIGEYSDRNERVTRFCCAVRRPGARGRVGFVPANEPAGSLLHRLRRFRFRVSGFKGRAWHVRLGPGLGPQETV